MTNQSSHSIAKKVRSVYEKRTEKSYAHFARAQESLPGGDTRTAAYFSPYPTYIERVKGCYVYDVDGNEYIDVLGNYTSLVHGHAHPLIVQAIKAQAEKGTILFSPSESQYLLAEEICSRISGRIAYCEEHRWRRRCQ